MTFVSDEMPITRPLVGAGISLAWLFAVLVCSPYRVKIDNQLAALSHLSLSLLLLVCCMVRMYHSAVRLHHTTPNTKSWASCAACAA